MSIGNLKDSGNQGNNFPWQLKMLLGQQCACDQLTAINANTDDVEFLLTSILTTLQASTEYEAKFVVDTCDSDKVYLEVRVWNPDTSTWGPITYYLPGSDTPVIPVGASTPGCLIYTDPSGVLGMILAELQLQTPILTDIEINTGDTVTELQSILALYSAGPQACADSLSVTLCTEQGTSLSNIETNTTGLATETTLASVLTELQDINLDTNGLSQEATQLLIQALLITIDADTSNLDVALSTVATEVTLASVLLELQGINLDTNGLSQEATQLLIQALLTTIDADTSNLDVALSTVATETTLTSLLTAFNLEDFATEATLSAVNTQLTSVVRTPNFLRPTGALGTITAGTFSMSFASVGTADATVGGMTLKPGETLNFDAGALNNTLGAVAYDTLTNVGAELIIITLT